MPKVIAARRSQGALSRDLVACYWRIRIPYPGPDISLAAAPSNATLAVQIPDGSTHFQLLEVRVLAPTAYC